MKSKIILPIFLFILCSCSSQFDVTVVDIKYYDDEHIQLKLDRLPYDYYQQQGAPGYLVVKIKIEEDFTFRSNSGLLVTAESRYCNVTNVNMSSFLSGPGATPVPNDIEIDNPDNYYYFAIMILDDGNAYSIAHNLYDNIDDICSFINPVQPYAFGQSTSNEFKIDKNDIQLILLNGWIEGEDDF